MSDDPHDMVHDAEWYETHDLPGERRAPPGAWLGPAIIIAAVNLAALVWWLL